MLQVLLEDRFKLVMHEEPAVVSVWALVADRKDGRLGPSIRPFTGECITASDPPNRPRSPADIAGSCGTRGGPGAVSGTGATVGSILAILAASLSTPVIDRTGLTGRYDLDLKWTPKADSLTDVALVDGTSIFTAVREQLGLRLQAEKGSGKVFVIDRVERPEPN